MFSNRATFSVSNRTHLEGDDVLPVPSTGYYKFAQRPSYDVEKRSLATVEALVKASGCSERLVIITGDFLLYGRDFQRLLSRRSVLLELPETGTIDRKTLEGTGFIVDDTDSPSARTQKIVTSDYLHLNGIVPAATRNLVYEKINDLVLNKKDHIHIDLPGGRSMDIRLPATQKRKASTDEEEKKKTKVAKVEASNPWDEEKDVPAIVEKTFDAMCKVIEAEKNDALVLVGCGGDLDEWVRMTRYILRKGHGEKIVGGCIPSNDDLTHVYKLTTTGGRTDLVLTFKNVNWPRLSMWRLQFGDCSWWSDYEVNYADHH